MLLRLVNRQTFVLDNGLRGRSEGYPPHIRPKLTFERGTPAFRVIRPKTLGPDHHYISPFSTRWEHRRIAEL